MWSDADWVNTGLAGFGVLVAIVGLAIVVWQVRKARSAAEAASQAATEAREAMARYVTAADLGSVRAGLRTLQEQLRAGQFEPALAACQSIREQVAGLRTRRAFQTSQRRLDEHDRVMQGLSEVQESLERTYLGTGPELDVATANGRISGLLDRVVEWQDGAVFLDTEEPSHDHRV